MPYLIDGHNLIGQAPFLSLDDPDDEVALLEVLSRFLVRTRKRAHVFFDRASPGSCSPAPHPRLHVRFIRAPRTADEAIHSQLAALKGEAANWTVVSSDHEVQDAGRRFGAKVIDSRAFADMLLVASQRENVADAKPSAALSSDEIDAWEKLFQDQGDKP